MTLFVRSLFVCALSIGLAACTNSPPEAQAIAAPKPDDPNIEVKRTIVVTGASRCQLKVQRGRDAPELYTAKSCGLKTDASGIVSAVTAAFDAPCKQYVFNNLIGELYFLDEKAIGARNASCPVEAFNASYGWALEKS